MTNNIYNLLPSAMADRANKHKKLNIGDNIAKYMAGDSSNKIESQKWLGLDNSRNSKLKDLLYRSDFITERISAGEDNAMIGKIVPVLLILNGKWVIEHFILTSANIIKNKIILNEGDSVTAIRTPKYDVFGSVIDDSLTYNWKKKDGRVILTVNEVIKKNGKEMKEVVSSMVYPGKVSSFPGSPIRNNSKGVPDWIRVVDILIEVNALSNDLGPEWEMIKTQFNNMASFGKGVKGTSEEQAIINGRRIKDVFSTNSKFAAQLQAVMSGSQTTSLLIQQIAYLEDRALKYAFQGRDMDSSGNNKHNMQVGLFNQAHGEYTMIKIEQRQRDYMWFFKEIVEPITGIKAPSKIEIQNSIFEQGKIEGMNIMKEQAKLYRAQATAQDAQSKKHLADAKKSTEEAKVVDSNDATMVVESTQTNNNK